MARSSVAFIIGTTIGTGSPSIRKRRALSIKLVMVPSRSSCACTCTSIGSDRMSGDRSPGSGVFGGVYSGSRGLRSMVHVVGSNMRTAGGVKLLCISVSAMCHHSTKVRRSFVGSFSMVIVSSGVRISAPLLR